MSDTVRKNLGIVTAYAYARSKGYEGTEEEFAELMASYADVAEEAAQSASEAAQSAVDAAESESAAAGSALSAQQSAQAAAGQVEAAQAAKTGAEQAAGAAENSANTAAGRALAASGFADAAEQSATNASGSATAAQNYSGTAATAAQTASGYADDAGDSATAAAGSATAAAASAAEAAESARTLTIDDTLTQQGQAADSKKTGDEISALKADFSYESKREYIKFTVDKYIKNDYEDGTVISTSMTDYSGISCAIYDCNPGDKVFINGKGSSGARLWSFLDSTNAIIKKAATSEQRNDLYLIAPPTTAKVIINTFNTDKGMCYIETLSKEFQFCHKAFIRTQGAAGDTVNLIPEANNDWSYAVASCQEGDVVYITGKGSSGGRLWAFLNSSNEIISNAGIYDENVVVTAPENADKVVVNSYTANLGKCEINYVEPLMERNTKRHKIVAGVIRNSGNGWEFIINNTHQGDLNCASVSTNENGEIVINYPDINAKKVISLLLATDETFASLGYIVGASVGTSSCNVKVYKYVPKCATAIIECTSEGFSLLSDVSKGVNEIEWRDDNKYLIVRHGQFPMGEGNLISLVPYKYGTAIPRLAAQTGANSTYIEFIDPTTLQKIDTLGSNLSFSFSRMSPSKLELVQQDANDIVNANGNFWFMGIFEL